MIEIITGREKEKKKFFIKFCAYALVIGLTSLHSHTNYGLLHEHIFLQEFNVILYTKYLLNFIIGLGMVIAEFLIVKSDEQFITYLEGYVLKK